MPKKTSNKEKIIFVISNDTSNALGILGARFAPFKCLDCALDLKTSALNGLLLLNVTLYGGYGRDQSLSQSLVPSVMRQAWKSMFKSSLWYLNVLADIKDQGQPLDKVL